MPKITNENKNTSIFLKDKVLRGVTGYKQIRFIEGYINSDTVDVKARLTLSYARCPLCGKKSHSVHSTYERQLMDLPIQGKRMNIKLLARRFRCRNLKCRQIVFSEQPTGIAERYSRKTIVAKSKLQSILIELSATKGAVVVSSMGMSQSASTCLRLIKSIEIKVNKASVKHICIDDFAYRKGAKYGTIIIDADTRKTIALINSRETDHVAEALKAYPNVKTVSRDRSSAYTVKNGLYPPTQNGDIRSLFLC